MERFKIIATDIVGAFMTLKRLYPDATISVIEGEGIENNGGYKIYYGYVQNSVD